MEHPIKMDDLGVPGYPYFWKHPDSMMIFGPLRWNHRHLDFWGVESKHGGIEPSPRWKTTQGPLEKSESSERFSTFPVFLFLRTFKQLQTAKCCVVAVAKGLCEEEWEGMLLAIPRIVCDIYTLSGRSCQRSPSAASGRPWLEAGTNVGRLQESPYQHEDDFEGFGLPEGLLAEKRSK